MKNFKFLSFFQFLNGYEKHLIFWNLFFLIFKLPLRIFQNFQNYFFLEYFWFILGSQIFRYASLIEKMLQHLKNPYIIFLTLTNLPYLSTFEWWYLNPLSGNPTKWSNTLNLSEICQRILWVCLTILWNWHLKG